MASLLCLLPAYQTILQAAQRYQELFTPDHNVKISRFAMAKCQHNARRMLHDNEAVLAYGQRMERSVVDSFPAGT